MSDDDHQDEHRPTRLILVRHGESVATVNRVIGGPRTCAGLSELGRQQAERLRERLEGRPFTDEEIVSILRKGSGTVTLSGTDVSRLPTHRLSRLGLAYVPAERHLFPQMSVMENLQLGAFPGRPDPDRQALVFDVFPRLAERTKQDAGTMSGGEQQMLAVARALMSNPKVLMLDEPTTGLAPRLAREAYVALGKLRDAGLTLVVAEQQVPLALELAASRLVALSPQALLAQLSDRLRLLGHGPADAPARQQTMRAAIACGQRFTASSDSLGRKQITNSGLASRPDQYPFFASASTCARTALTCFCRSGRRCASSAALASR